MSALLNTCELMNCSQDLNLFLGRTRMLLFMALKQGRWFNHIVGSFRVVLHFRHPHFSRVAYGESVLKHVTDASVKKFGLFVLVSMYFNGWVFRFVFNPFMLSTNFLKHILLTWFVVHIWLPNVPPETKNKISSVNFDLCICWTNLGICNQS